MSVQELSLLHRRYIDLSDRFKAAWTFHQFLQGIHKVFSEEVVGREQVSFQAVYANLKSISQNLNASSTKQLREQLDGVESELNAKIDRLLKEDSKVPPSILRQFFQRVSRYNDKILLQLVKFFVYNGKVEAWTSDRVDKVDFLLTKLSDELAESEKDPIERDADRLNEILHNLWALLHVGLVSDDEVHEHLAEIARLRREMAAVRDLDELNERAIVQRYRQLKHGLGRLYIEPQLAAVIIRSNVEFRETIQRLYRVEEQRIHAEFNEVFALERQAILDPKLEADLQTFREEIEQFERRLEDSNLRLEEVARLRQQVRALLPRLRSATKEGSAGSAEPPTEEAPPPPSPEPARPERPPKSDEEEEAKKSLGGRRPTGAVEIDTPHADLIGDGLSQVLKALDASDWKANPRALAKTPEMRPLRIQPREIVAYRRLLADEDCDRDLEQFLLECAAVRVVITREAEEIVGLVAAPGDNGHPDLFREARETTRLADSFESRLDHYTRQALEENDSEEARVLQFLRMRLLRDYTGLFLLLATSES